MNAARRGEALSLEWKEIDFDSRSAYPSRPRTPSTLPTVDRGSRRDVDDSDTLVKSSGIEIMLD